MASRTALLGFLATALLTGYSRTAAPVAQPAAEPAGVRPIVDRLAEPVPVEVDGVPLVRDGYCNIVPFVGDIDGDGRPALLLGTSVTHGEGRLLVYRNVGTSTTPRLSRPQWFDDVVPTGSIPPG